MHVNEAGVHTLQTSAVKAQVHCVGPRSIQEPLLCMYVFPCGLRLAGQRLDWEQLPPASRAVSSHNPANGS